MGEHQATRGLVVDSTGNDVTYRINGAAMRVHNRLGYGYKEEVYERALAVELAECGIAAARQFEVKVEYRGTVVAVLYLDLMVEGTVAVEVKAFSHLLTDDERAQMVNYLKACGAPVGLFFNFGRRRLEYKRIPPGSAGDAVPLQRLGRDNVRQAELPEPDTH